MLSKSLPLSSNFTMDEEAKACEKQGIVSILGSDSEKTNTTPSLRRTLSADMSSQKWLAQNGFSSLKKIFSSHELLASIDDSSSTSSEDYEEKERLEIWNSIQEAKLNKDGEEPEKTKESTSWISILSQKVEDSNSKAVPPYVHPLVKRSASTLSAKSLEICTESLGSETGSDGFSSYPPSDAEDDKAEENLVDRAKPQTVGKEVYDIPPVKYDSYLGPKKSANSRTFPPPLPSLSKENGASLSMRSSRNNGRLVLEAVSVSSQKNNFQAKRLEGRLILTFVAPAPSIDQEVESVEEVEEEKPVVELDEESVVFGNKCEDEDDGYEEEGDELKGEEEMEEPLKLNTKFSVAKAPNMPSGVVNLHKLALMMNKPIGLPNKNPKWASKFNEAVVNKYPEAAEEEEEEEPISIQQSLPLQPQVARMIPNPPAKTASSFNAYDYFWRAKPATTSSTGTVTKQPLSSIKNYSTNCTISKNLLGRGDVYCAGTPIARSCNEPRRSLFFWEANCIATS